MFSGRKNQVTKQIGEYLVASELARRGYICATFSGNVPDYDIVAVDDNGNTKLIQVKTINGGSWQFSIDKFVKIRMEGNKQIVGEKIPQRLENIICVFVLLGNKSGNDTFYLIKWNELQDLLIELHEAYLKKHDGERPKSKESVHVSIYPKDLKNFIENWNILNNNY